MVLQKIVLTALIVIAVSAFISYVNTKDEGKNEFLFHFFLFPCFILFHIILFFCLRTEKRNTISVVIYLFAVVVVCLIWQSLWAVSLFIFGTVLCAVLPFIILFWGGIRE